MNLLTYFQQKSKFFYVFIVLMGLINSLMYSGLLFIINNFISRRPLPYFPQYEWMVFIVLLGLSLLSSKIFQSYMVKLTNEILFDFEMALLQKVRRASFEAFEKIGNHRLYTAIADTRTLSNLPSSFVSAFNSMVLILCCIGYMFWVSIIGGLSITLLMSGLLIFYLVKNKNLKAHLNRIRDLHNSYYQYLHDFINGFKEIKMSSKRNDNIFDSYLRKNRTLSKDIGISTAIRYLNNELTGGYSWYVVLGVVLFCFPKFFNLGVEQVATFIITILYVMAPIAALVSLLPGYTGFKIALERLNQLDQELDIADTSDIVPPPLSVGSAFQGITFQHVCFEYYDQHKQKTFSVGPLNFELPKGEVLFVTGGNGSGKSTFINLLTGLYRPKSGKIFLNGIEVTKDRSLNYTDEIGAIFTNNYLFNENYDDFDLSENNEELRNYIHLMQLSDLFKSVEGKFNITNKLSKGQQKRLAMIYTLLENKEVIVLDEWAAEQDPAFRSYFYRSLLPHLKVMGKTVVAVTHDDDYYAFSDRVIKFDYGSIVLDKRVHAEELETVLMAK